MYHENVLRIAQELGDKAVEARAFAGLGHAARCAGDYNQVSCFTLQCIISTQQGLLHPNKCKLSKLALYSVNKSTTSCARFKILLYWVCSESSVKTVLK